MAKDWPHDLAKKQFNYDAKVYLADHSKNMYYVRGQEAKKNGVPFVNGPKRSSNNLIPMFQTALADMADAWEAGWKSV